MTLTDVVRTYYEAVDGGDVERIVELFSEDATYLRPGYLPFSGTADLLRFYSSERIIRDGRHAYGSLIADGDLVAVRGIFTGHGHDGAVIDLEFADFFRGDDRIRWRQTFFYAPLV